MRNKLAVILLIILTSVGAQTNQIALSLMTEAKMYFDRNKYYEAYKKVSEAIGIDKTNAEAYFLRGEINYAMLKYEDALKDYNAALQNRKEYPEALSGKILALSYTNQIKEASDLVDAAIKEHPSDPNFYFCRGILNNQKEKYSRAIEDFDKALTLGDPKEYRIYLYRGVAKLNLQEYDGAKEDLNLAIELDPKNPSAYHSRGRVHYEQKDYEEAIKDFNISLNYNPKNEVALYNLGMTYYRLEKNDEACKYFHESCSMGYIHACKMIVMECGK